MMTAAAEQATKCLRKARNEEHSNSRWYNFCKIATFEMACYTIFDFALYGVIKVIGGASGAETTLAVIAGIGAVASVAGARLIQGPALSQQRIGGGYASAPSRLPPAPRDTTAIRGDEFSGNTSYQTGPGQGL